MVQFYVVYRHSIATNHISTFGKLLIYTSLVCVNFFSVSAQNSQHIIVDSLGKQEIPYATIVWGDGKGVYADSKGYFNFSYADTHTVVTISSIGYHKKQYTLSEDKRFLPDTLFLSPSIYKIDEIVITPDREKLDILELGFAHQKAKTKISGGSGAQIAVWIPNLQKIKGTIHSFEMKMKKSNQKHLFRIHLYMLDEQTKGPGEPLLDTSLVYFVNQLKAKVSIKLDHLNISFPDKGVFAGMEWLGLINEDNVFIGDFNKIGSGLCPYLAYNFSSPEVNTWIKSPWSHWKWSTIDKGYAPGYYELFHPKETNALQALIGIKVLPQ